MTDNDNTVLIIGGRIQTLRKAVDLGLRVVLIQHKEHFVPEAAKLAHAVLIADYTDWEITRPLVEAAHRVYGFTRVVSITEPGLVPAGKVSDLLGLGGTTERTAELLRDKLAMRHHLAAHPDPAVRASSVAAAPVTDAASILAFGETHGYPFIVKPADATASLGVVKVDSAAQVAEVWAGIEALRGRDDLLWGDFFTIDSYLMEQYIEGPEYSVETFSFAGDHVVIAITEKLTREEGFVELGHALPARLAPAVEQQVVDAVAGMLDALGLTDGPSHTEIRISPTGPKVIESHNRMGGDRIFDLIEAGYGINLEQWTVAWPFRLIEHPAQRPVPNRSAATRFLVAEPGTVTEVRGVAEATADPDTLDIDVTAAVGATVNPLSGNWDRVGQVLATGRDTCLLYTTPSRSSPRLPPPTLPSAATPTRKRHEQQDPPRDAQHLRLARRPHRVAAPPGPGAAPGHPGRRRRGRRPLHLRAEAHPGAERRRGGGRRHRRRP